MLTVIAGLIAIGALVLVHELGHFVVARMFGIAAPVFSVGMGPRIAGFHWRGTDVRISVLPIGGYVMLAGADPFGEEDAESAVPKEQSFAHKPVWQKLLVMAAGPGVNLALPVFLFTAVLMAGRPDLSNEIGTVLPDTEAAAAGLAPGDVIVAVEGRPVEVWPDIAAAWLRARGDVAMTVARDGVERQVELPAAALVPHPDGGVDSYAVGVLPYTWSTRVAVAGPDTPAAAAGLRTGDLVVDVDGEEVLTWAALHAALAQTPDIPAVLTVERGDPRREEATQHTIMLAAPAPEGWSTAAPAPLADAWGLVPVASYVSAVSEGSPAERAGVQVGDRILSLDGAAVWSFDHFITRVARRHTGTDAAQSMRLTLSRAGELVEVDVTPEMRVVPGEAYMRPIIGVQSYAGGARVMSFGAKRHTLAEAFPRALDETGRLMHATVALLGNLLTGQADVAHSVGGPVAIVQVAGESAERGVLAFASLLGMLSISLGLINLLPIPVLDGGQILFYLIEAVRGRPLSLELREKVQMAGVMMLVVMMLYVTVNDIQKWIGS